MGNIGDIWVQIFPDNTDPHCYHLSHFCSHMSGLYMCNNVAGLQNLDSAMKMSRIRTFYLLVCVHWLHSLVSSCAAVDAAVEEDSPA